MDYYLIDDNAGVTLHLPVNPETCTIKREASLDTVNIINLGEIDFLIGTKVKEIAFSSFFPAEYDAEYCKYSDITDPQKAMNQLTAWMASERPIRLIITDTIINSLVRLSAHNSEFRGGEPGDVYYDITLRTWTEVKVRTQAEVASSTTSAGVYVARPDTKAVPKIYTVKPGDSLWKIAKLQLGDGSKWSTIYANNKAAIGSNPNSLAIGTKLVIQ